MYHLSCFHLSSLAYPAIFNPNFSTFHPPNTCTVLFLSPTQHPNDNVISHYFASSTTILDITIAYTAHFTLTHTAITVNGTPARVFISSAIRLHQLSSPIIISHAPTPTISLSIHTDIGTIHPWPWPSSTTQVICLPQHATPFCGRSHILHLDSDTPLALLPTYFAHNSWCCPNTCLHIFWLTSLAPPTALQDVPGPLRLEHFGPQALLFELDKSIPVPNRHLLKILRHTYLRHAPVLHILSQHYHQLTKAQKLIHYPSGPFTCTHYTATLCLQQPHSRDQHLRQLGLPRYETLRRATDYSTPDGFTFTPPSRIVVSLTAAHLDPPGLPSGRALTPAQIQTFLQTALASHTWTQSPTTNCQIRLPDATAPPLHFEVPDTILLWQFENPSTTITTTFFTRSTTSPLLDPHTYSVMPFPQDFLSPRQFLPRMTLSLIRSQASCFVLPYLLAPAP